jgi:hypothetical protein
MGLAELSSLAETARRQAGAVSIEQARAAGVSDGIVRRAVRSGLLERVHPRVLRFTSRAPDELSMIWASVLEVGRDSRASHEACLWLHAVARIGPVPVVSVPPEHSHRQRGIRVHRFGDLVPEHLAVVRGVPTTTLERAVVDVTSVLRPARLADLVDRITITTRATTLGAIARTYRQVNRRGRHRIATLGRILDERGDRGPVNRSTLESAADRLLWGARLPTPVREHPLPNHGGLVGFVDRAWPEVRLLLEIDGRSWHSRERDMARDRARDRMAAAQGWLTVRVLDVEVRDQPDLVVTDLELAYRSRRDQLATSPPPELLGPTAALSTLVGPRSVR